MAKNSGVFNVFTKSALSYAIRHQITATTELMCLTVCITNNDCYSVNFREADKICEIGSFYDSRNLALLSPDNNSTHYTFF